MDVRPAPIMLSRRIAKQTLLQPEAVPPRSTVDAGSLSAGSSTTFFGCASRDILTRC